MALKPCSIIQPAVTTRPTVFKRSKTIQGIHNTASGWQSLLSNTTGNVTPPTVRSRSLATLPAPSTQRWVAERCLAIPPAITTPPREGLRSRATLLATTTRPSVLMRFMATPSVCKTQPRVLLRSFRTRPEITTRPTVSKRSKTIQRDPQHGYRLAVALEQYHRKRQHRQRWYCAL